MCYRKDYSKNPIIDFQIIKKRRKCWLYLQLLRTERREKHRILPIESSNTCKKRPGCIHGRTLYILRGQSRCTDRRNRDNDRSHARRKTSRSRTVVRNIHLEIVDIIPFATKLPVSNPLHYPCMSGQYCGTHRQPPERCPPRQDRNECRLPL